jgi:hypothetical protein
VLGLLLVVGEQCVGELKVVLRARAARPGSRDGVHVGATVLHLHERLRARSDDVIRLACGVDEAQQVHVRARVERAKHPVHVDGVCGDLVVEALGHNDLEDVAITDVLLGALDGGLVVGRGGARDRRRLNREIDLGEPGLVRLREPGLQRIESRLR